MAGFPHTPNSRKRRLAPASLSCLRGGCDLPRELFMWGQGRGLPNNCVAKASLFLAAVVLPRLGCRPSQPFAERSSLFCCPAWASGPCPCGPSWSGQGIAQAGSVPRLSPKVGLGLGNRVRASLVLKGSESPLEGVSDRTAPSSLGKERADLVGGGRGLRQMKSTKNDDLVRDAGSSRSI